MYITAGFILSVLHFMLAHSSLQMIIARLGKVNNLPYSISIIAAVTTSVSQFLDIRTSSRRARFDPIIIKYISVAQ
jgi:DMSO/TMAO reductase YedYZ heme-binding membrane subunit